LFYLLAIFVSFQIFRRKGVDKVVWFFGGILFFPPTIILLENPLVSFPRFMIYTLLIATIFQLKHIDVMFRRFPLKGTLICVFLLLLSIGIMDDRLSLFHKIYRPLVYFIEKFLILFLTYLYLSSIKDLSRLYYYLFR